MMRDIAEQVLAQMRTTAETRHACTSTLLDLVPPDLGHVKEAVECDLDIQTGSSLQTVTRTVPMRITCKCINQAPVPFPP